MNKNLSKSKIVKIGTYNTVVSLVVIALAIILNLVISKLPANFTKFDTTSSEVFSLSEQTKSIIKSLNDDITFYLIAETGSEDTKIVEMLDRYAALNSKIKIQKVDPVLRPTFITDYTTETLNSNSVIVVNNKRSFAIDYNDIYVTEYIPYDQWTEMQQYYYQSYGEMPTASYFAAESVFTGAIDYVTSPSLPKIYTLQGHGETALTADVTSLIKFENIETGELRLESLSAVPDDANCVLINNPTTDITETESTLLLSYMQSGGKVILITYMNYYTTEGMPNITKLCTYNGLCSSDGVIIDPSSGYYTKYQNYLLPKLTDSDVSALMTNSNVYILTPFAHGIKKTETAGVGTVSPLIITSDSAFVKDKESTSAEKETGNEEGPFYVGALTSNKDTGSKFIWYSSPFILTNAYSNLEFFMSSVSLLCEKTSSISILSKRLSSEYLLLTEGQYTLWSVVFTLVIPLAVIVIGLSIWLRRRKK